MDYMSILNAILLDDQTLVERMASQNVPARYAEFSVNSDGPGPSEWIWQDSNGTSHLTVSAIPPFRDADAYIERLMWQVGDGLGRLDVSWHHSAPQAPTPVAIGELGAGMLYSGPDSKTYYGLADVSSSSTVTASFWRYGDLECANPLPLA